MAIQFAANIFTPKSEQLQTILPSIANHKTVLPNFQRPWVWEPDMVRDLIVSVANRYPAGSLLTMPIASETFALRPFAGTGDILQTGPNLMILDGQQRLTSLFQALFSHAGVHAPDGRIYFFYLDVANLMDESESFDPQGDQSPFGDCVFFVEERKGNRKRYDRFTEIADLSSREGEIEHAAYPLHLLFSPNESTQWVEAFNEARSDGSLAGYKAQGARWGSLVAPWLHGITSYPFPVVELRSDMPLPAICHIFEKVNSTGVPLNVFDLCTAILWAQEFKLNDKWDETRKRLQADQILRMQGPLDGTSFLQVISLLSSLDRKRKSPESRIAVNCRRDDLLKLKAHTVDAWWSVAEAAYRDASKFMESQGIISRRVLPYSTLLIPLAAIFGTLRASGISGPMGNHWPKIERWYWCSVFSHRYSSSVEASASVDLEQVISWIEGGDVPEVVRTFTFSADRLQEISTIRNVVYKGVLCLLSKNGAKDLGGEGTLSVNLFYDSHQDHHHIFPKAALEKLGIQDPRSESIVNKTLIGASANRSIGGRLPSAYMQTMESRLGDDRVSAILRSHLITPETMRTDNWTEFVLARREELKELIRMTCGDGIQDFSDGQRASLPLHIQRLHDDVAVIEVHLRSLIAKFTEGDWSLVPDHVRVRANDRLEKRLRENPSMDKSHYGKIEGKLEFCDLRELESIISSKTLWQRFSDVFGSKEALATRFQQLAPMRNAMAHSRTLDELSRMDGEAAIHWFKGALVEAERSVTAESIDIPEDEPEPDLAEFTA